MVRSYDRVPKAVTAMVPSAPDEEVCNSLFSILRMCLSPFSYHCSSSPACLNTSSLTYYTPAQQEQLTLPTPTSLPRQYALTRKWSPKKPHGHQLTARASTLAVAAPPTFTCRLRTSSANSSSTQPVRSSTALSLPALPPATRASRTSSSTRFSASSRNRFIPTYASISLYFLQLPRRVCSYCTNDI